jgi:hypothetical protein
MVEIKININKDNKDKILKLLNELVEAETGSSSESSTQTKESEESNQKKVNEDDYKGYAKYFDKPVEYTAELLLQPSVTSHEFGLGTTFLFNSFFAAKAMLRAIANLTNEKKEPASVEDVLQVFYKAAKARDLQKIKGFPKERSKQRHEGSNENRPLYSIILPLSELGLLSKENDKVYLTKAGLELAQLDNPKLDENKESLLSEKEIEFITDYLKQIDAQGYKEYSVLKGFVNYIKEMQQHGKMPSYQDLTKYFYSNQGFVDFLYKNSKFGKRGIPKETHDFNNWVKRESRAIASSKISILRELGVLENKRNSYKILKNW